MLGQIEARAPGKLVVAGEYAVLNGAPGIAVAVAAQAIARVRPLAGGTSRLVLPDTGQEFCFSIGQEGQILWQGKSPGAFGLPLEACSEILHARGLLPSGEWQQARYLELTTGAFHHVSPAGHRTKLGLGSSAAVVVALIGALLRLTGVDLPARRTLIAIACEAHLRLQGGVGSGIDVATSITGGTVAVAFDSGNPTPQVYPVPWPRHLSLVAVWTGQSASTPAMLARFQAYRLGNQTGFAADMERLGVHASHAVTAFRLQDLDQLFRAITDYEAALRQLDQAARIGIFSPVHEQLGAIAHQHGAVYKPSGAGGGDFGIALTQSRKGELGLRADFQAAGFALLSGPICGPGLSVAARA